MTKACPFSLAAIVCVSCGPPTSEGPAPRDGGSPQADAPADHRPHPAPPDAPEPSWDGWPVPPDAPREAAPPRPDGGTTPLPPDVLRIAGDLHGAYLELECDSEEIELQYCVPKDRGIRNVMLRFGGEPGRMYSVVLKIWAVVETVTYKGGVKGGDHFYISGTSGTPMTAEYGLEVGARVYHLNHMELGAGDHYTYGLQYTTPAIGIPGASTLVLFVRDPNNFVNTNHMMSEESLTRLPPALQRELDRMNTQPFPVQFVYVEVASARIAP